MELDNNKLINGILQGEINYILNLFEYHFLNQWEFSEKFAIEMCMKKIHKNKIYSGGEEYEDIKRAHIVHSCEHNKSNWQKCFGMRFWKNTLFLYLNVLDVFTLYLRKYVLLGARWVATATGDFDCKCIEEIDGHCYLHKYHNTLYQMRNYP